MTEQANEDYVLPWHTEKAPNNGLGATVVDAEGDVITDILEEDTAELIVLAVNSHYDLLEVCVGAEEFLSVHNHAAPDQMLSAFVKKIRAAIAKAKP